MKTVIHTNSAEETMAFGERLGSLLRRGDVLALFGDLGAGKTTFTKGLALGLKLTDDIHSPTFTLIHEHPGDIALYHIDLYRLSCEAEVEMIGIEEYIYGDGVTIIEWADRMKSMLPQSRLDIEFKMKSDTQRELTLETQSPELEKIIEEVTDYVNHSN